MIQKIDGAVALGQILVSTQETFAYPKITCILEKRRRKNLILERIKMILLYFSSALVDLLDLWWVTKPELKIQFLQ